MSDKKDKNVKQEEIFPLEENKCEKIVFTRRGFLNKMAIGLGGGLIALSGH